LRPVLLTARTPILGLIPLAIGLNINFITLMSEFYAHSYMGGHNVILWRPRCWTEIYGLIVATFLTLVVVPVLFSIVHRLKLRFRKDVAKPEQPKIEKGEPLMV